MLLPKPTRTVRPWLAAVLIVLITMLALTPAMAQSKQNNDNQQPDLKLAAPTAILIDASSGKVLYTKNAYEKWQPASVTKIMTLTLIFQALKSGKLSLNDKVQTSKQAASYGGSQIFLAAGEKMSVKRMIKAIAVVSANDAAAAMAEKLGGSESGFVKMMNDKAKQLGLTNTHFQNPHGLGNSEHYTTVHDMAVLSRYLITHYPQVLDYTKIQVEYFDKGTDKARLLTNTNRKFLQDYRGADGLKTGHINASGWNLVATAKRGHTRLISVVFGEKDPKQRLKDTETLMDYGFGHYETVRVAKSSQEVGTVHVDLGKEQQLKAVTRASLAVTVPKGQGAAVEQNIQLPERIEAPVKQGQEIGTIKVTLDGNELGSVPLVADRTVDRISLPGLAWRLFKHIWPLSNWQK